MNYLKNITFIKNKKFQKYVLGGLGLCVFLGGIGYLVKKEILSSFEKIKEIEKISEEATEEEANEEEANEEEENKEGDDDSEIKKQINEIEIIEENNNNNRLEEYLKNYRENEEINNMEE